jgi:uncharacterized protein YciI
MLFSILCNDKPGRHEVRLATQPLHLAYLQTYKSKLILAGPLLDADDRPCGSLLIVDVADWAEAEGFAESDPAPRRACSRAR